VWRDDITPLDTGILHGLGHRLAGGDRPLVLDRMVALAVVVAGVAIGSVGIDRDLHVRIRHCVCPVADGHAVVVWCAVGDASSTQHEGQQ